MGSIELHRQGDGVTTVWSTSLVNITLLKTGKVDERKPGNYILAVSRQVHTPSGHLGFLGLLRGLPVLRVRIRNRRERLIFVTLDGNVIIVTPHREPLAPLFLGSGFPGVGTPIPVVRGTEAERPQTDWNISAYLSAKLGCFILVSFLRNGDYVLDTEYTNLHLIDQHVQIYLNGRGQGTTK